MRVLNLVKIHSILKDLFIKEKWLLFSASLCIVIVVVVLIVLPSVLRRCWLGCRKGIRPVKNLSGGCWHGYQSRARCRLAYVPADATAVPKPYHLLPHLHPDWFYYSGTSLPRLSWKLLLLLQPFNGLFSRTTWVSRYQKGKTNLDFTGARDSE